MISRIHGKIKNIRADGLLIEVSGISYDVLIPAGIHDAVEEASREREDMELIIFHYLQTTPSRATPVLIGFLNEIEKEFFARFITVSGVGPKAAVRALALPISTIADAIDSGDTTLLKSLPGIGSQKAKEIIAKLQGKVGKYGLIQDTVRGTPTQAVPEDVAKEAEAVLAQLQYSAREARKMVEDAVKINPDLETTEEILNAVYRQRRKTAERK